MEPTFGWRHFECTSKQKQGKDWFLQLVATCDQNTQFWVNSQNLKVASHPHALNITCFSRKCFYLTPLCRPLRRIEKDGVWVGFKGKLYLKEMKRQHHASLVEAWESCPAMHVSKKIIRLRS